MRSEPCSSEDGPVSMDFPLVPPLSSAYLAQPRGESSARAQSASRIAAALALVADRVPLQRRMMRAGDLVYGAGELFTHIYVLHSGLAKIVNSAADGRNQVVALHFKGDWLGFDGIACGRYGCDTVALDIGEVWSLEYETLLHCCRSDVQLLQILHAEMSRTITRSRDALLSRCTLPAAARVAEFLLYWAESLDGRGQRTDHITLRMTRAEIGNYLGMTLESVSRSLSGLARHGVIGFTEKGRREIVIHDLRALALYVDGHAPPCGGMVQ